jgi:hypothetical protein
VRPGLISFADARRLKDVQPAGLGAVLAQLLMTDLQRDIEQRTKTVFEFGNALDLGGGCRE